MKTWKHSAKRLTVLLFAWVLCMGLTPSVFAEDNIDEWNMGETKDVKKVWTVEFNQPIESSKVSSTTVYVRDEYNRKVSTNVTLTSDKKSIRVEPNGEYETGKVYKLYLDDSIRSESDKSLKEAIVFPFTVLAGTEEEPSETEEQPNGEENPKPAEEQQEEEVNRSVTDVAFSLTSYATVVSVLTDDTVATVRVDYKDMHYKGNNQYSTGIVGLEVGDTVMIRAYDGSGNEVFEKEYTVK